jgi:hypothetical protein
MAGRRFESLPQSGATDIFDVSQPNPFIPGFQPVQKISIIRAQSRVYSQNPGFGSDRAP